MTATDELAEHGFVPLQRRRDGSVQYGMRPHRYLSYWVTTFPDGRAEMTWEFALGEYLRDKGLAVSGQDELSLLLFPAEEIIGRFEAGWVAASLEAVKARFSAMDFAEGT